MKKNLVVAGIFALMLVLGVNKVMADTIAYDFEDGTIQGWQIDMTAFSTHNVKSLDNINFHANTGVDSMKLFTDMTEKVVATPPYINASVFVYPGGSSSSTADLSAYTSVKMYVYVDPNTVILDSNPLNIGVYMQTGDGYDYFVTNANKRVNIAAGQEGTWVPVSIDFFGAQDKTGTQDMPVLGLSKVHVIGLNLSGCGVTNPQTGTINAYLDTVTYIGASSSANITVTVQGVTLGVSITGTINFGTVQMNTTTVSSNALTVTNTGSTAETYSLSLVNPSVWTVVAGPNTGNETYAMAALFNNAQPVGITFGSLTGNSVMDSPRKCSATIFAGDLNGVGVAASATRPLWLSFASPALTSAQTAQQIKLIVSAEKF